MSSKTALVIGGTGTTGPHLIDGLLDRGFDVSIFHRGVHEPPDLPDIEHIHGDPHFEDTIHDALGDRRFDVVVATYGRLRTIATAMQGRCQHLVATTASIVYQNSIRPDSVRPSGMKLMTKESDPLADANCEPAKVSARVLAAERAVLDHAANGDYLGTIIRYPKLYGPRDVVPREWSVIKRVRDGRSYMLLPNDGLDISTRCAAQNAAHALLLAIDQPHAANGQAFNCADTAQFTTRQWVEMVVDILGGGLEVVSIPMEIGLATHAELNPTPDRSPHMLLDTTKIRNELGYADVVSAEDATREYVAWLEANPPDPENYGAYVDQFEYSAEDQLLAAYQRAVAQILTDVPRAIPSRNHPLPHPKAPGARRDHLGR